MAKILIIDDDSQVCSLVGEFLSRHGHEVATAPNGDRGLKTAAILKPDLVLCDLDMPGLDGHDVVSIMRRDEHQGEIPIIFLSACTEHGRIRRSMNLGADDFITKTAPLEDILEAVTAKLQRHDKQRQRLDRQVEKAAEIFVGIIHDLNNQAPEVMWLAQTASGMVGEQNQIIQRVRKTLNTNGASGRPASVMIKNNNRSEFLKLSEVKAFLADGEYSNICWGRDQHMMFRKPLKQWQMELPADQFVRVHRHAIINLKFIDFVEKDPEGKQQIHLRDFTQMIPVSQRGTPVFNRCMKKFQTR